MLSFWGSILGRAIAALLGFFATLGVEAWRNKKRKSAIIKTLKRTLKREISHNNSVIQNMIKKELNDDSGFASHLTSLQTTSYLKAVSSGVIADLQVYEEVLTTYQIILDIKRLIDKGTKISGRANPTADPIFYLKGIDDRGSGHYINGIEELPQKLSQLERNLE